MDTEINLATLDGDTVVRLATCPELGWAVEAHLDTGEICCSSGHTCWMLWPRVRELPEVLTVTWTLEGVSDGGFRVNRVNLAHGRLRGHGDADTIRRVLAVRWLGALAYAEHVVILDVAPAVAGAPDGVYGRVSA